MSKTCQCVACLLRGTVSCFWNQVEFVIVYLVFFGILFEEQLVSLTVGVSLLSSHWTLNSSGTF